MTAPLIAVLLGVAAWWYWGGRRGLSRLAVYRPIALPDWIEGKAQALPLKLRAGWGSALGFGVWAFFGGGWGWFLGPLTALSTAIGLGFFVPEKAHQQHNKMVLDFPISADLLAACLSAGLPLREAIAEVGRAIDGPLGELYGRITTRIGLGEAEHLVWMSFSEHPVIGEMCRDLSLAVDSGLALAETVAGYAQRGRLVSQNLAGRKAKQVGVRVVFPMMVCYLPAFILLGVVPIVGGVIG